MPRTLVPMLAALMAGWLNDQQQHVIEFLREENRVLREHLGERRILLNDDQRRRLAAKGKVNEPLDWQLDGQAIVAAVDPMLYHQRATQGSPGPT